jgi:hypothetical protein
MSPSMLLLLLFDQTSTLTPTPPVGNGLWISSVGNLMISNDSKAILFGGPVPPPGESEWITNNADNMITDSGDFFIFGS